MLSLPAAWGRSSWFRGAGQEAQVPGENGARCPARGMSRIHKQEISHDVRTSKAWEHAVMYNRKQVKASGLELMTEVFREPHSLWSCGR